MNIVRNIMPIHLNRREFVIASLATVAAGCSVSASEEPLVRFGMVSDLHYAELPDGIDERNPAFSVDCEM